MGGLNDRGGRRHKDSAVTVQVQTIPFLGERLVGAAQFPRPTHMDAEGSLQTHLGQALLQLCTFTQALFANPGMGPFPFGKDSCLLE